MNHRFRDDDAAVIPLKKGIHFFPSTGISHVCEMSAILILDFVPCKHVTHKG